MQDKARGVTGLGFQVVSVFSSLLRVESFRPPGKVTYLNIAVRLT